MPNTYKSVATKLTTNTTTNIYTVPNSTTAVVKSLYLSNIDNAADTVEVCVRKSGAVSDVFLLRGASIGVATTLQVIMDPVVLQAGDILKVKASTANRLDIVLSVLEIS